MSINNNDFGLFSNSNSGGGGGGVSSVGATAPLTSSGGSNPTISTNIGTNKLLGRSSSGTGVAEEIAIGSGLTLSAGSLTNTATPTPLGYYLSISDSTTQRNPTGNIPRAVKFDTTDLSNGFSLQTETAVFTGTINNGGAGAGTILNVTSVTSGILEVGMVLTGGSITAGTIISAFTSGTGGTGTYVVSVSQNRTSATYTGTMTSQIVCANTGIYDIQFSSQLEKSDSGVDDVAFWLRKNGADLLNSAGNLSLQGASPAYQMAAWNYVIELLAGDIIELYWASADTNMSIYSETVQASPYVRPAIPSTILTITQQSGIMAGTGVTAINSLTSSVQTMAVGTSGTNFAINSSGSTHTFNLPTASSTNRGALSTTDWTRFANFQILTGYQALGSSFKSILMSNPSISNITQSIGLSNAQFRAVAVYVPIAVTVQGIRWFQTIQGAFTGSGFNGVALFSYSGGTITRIVASADSEATWETSANNTWGSVAFTSPQSISEGLYYIGLLYNGGATAPAIGGTVNSVNGNVNLGDFTNSAELSLILGSQTAMPTSLSLSAGGVTVSPNNPAVYLY